MKGFESRREKRGVAAQFDRVAGSYDLLTGLDPGYKRHLRISAERLAPASGARILDLCCGTGLSTEALVNVCSDAREIVGLDASEGMLARARKKRLGVNVRWVHGDAMRVRASGVEGPFDAIFMAYGIRNVVDPDACLADLRALLAPGGRLCLHEYSLDGPVSRAVWNAVTLGVIIPGGLVTSGSTEIYRYLRRSVLAFDRVPELEARLRAAGLVDVQSQTMDGWQRGIVHTFLARRPS